MKKLVIIFSALLISGCFNQADSVGYEKSGNKSFRIICLNNIEYYQYSRQMAPRYSKEGKLISCGKGRSL